MNLLTKLFHDPAPITWHDPTANRDTVQMRPQRPTEQDRLEAHQLIDQACARNPEWAKRAHLMTDIAAELMPWIEEKEINPVMVGLRQVSTDKLAKMNAELQNKETTYHQKALIKKVLLAQGYMAHAKKQMKRQYILQPILIAAMYTSMCVGIHGIFKQNDRTIRIGLAALAACYYIDHKVSKKFKHAMKDQKEFGDSLARDSNQMIEFEGERIKWFSAKNVNSK